MMIPGFVRERQLQIMELMDERAPEKLEEGFARTAADLDYLSNIRQIFLITVEGLLRIRSPIRGGPRPTTDSDDKRIRDRDDKRTQGGFGAKATAPGIFGIRGDGTGDNFVVSVGKDGQMIGKGRGEVLEWERRVLSLWEETQKCLGCWNRTIVLHSFGCWLSLLSVQAKGMGLE